MGSRQGNGPVESVRRWALCRRQGLRPRRRGLGMGHTGRLQCTGHLWVKAVWMAREDFGEFSVVF